MPGLCPSEGHKHGGCKVTETFVTEFCYWSEKIIALELWHIERNVSSSASIVQLAETRVITHLLTYATALLLDNFSLRSQQMVPNYFLCRPLRVYYGGLHTNWQTKALPMACNRQSSSWARILLLLILTHSLTQTDSIVAYASLGKEAVSYKNISSQWLFTVTTQMFNKNVLQLVHTP